MLLPSDIEKTLYYQRETNCSNTTKTVRVKYHTDQHHKSAKLKIPTKLLIVHKRSKYFELMNSTYDVFTPPNRFWNTQAADVKDL